MIEERKNEKYISYMNYLSQKVLNEYNNQEEKKKVVFKSNAYKKAIEIIQNYKEDIYEAKQLINIKGIGKSIIEKLEEIKEVPIETNPLSDIYGIGPIKAKELYDKGIKTILDLKENQELLRVA
jgi:DNA polymerase/3'-5' exonuclease PolX